MPSQERMRVSDVSRNPCFFIMCAHCSVAACPFSRPYSFSFSAPTYCMHACCLCPQTDSVVLNPVAVFKTLNQLAPDVTEESINSVVEVIGLMSSITLDDLLPILGRCGVTSAQCMRMRRILERNVPPTVRVPACGCVCFCYHILKTRAMGFSGKVCKVLILYPVVC